LELLVLCRLVWQQIGRGFDLEGSHFFQPAPYRYALGVTIRWQAEQQQKPGGGFHRFILAEERCIANPI
jgi:hypothetical protein